MAQYLCNQVIEKVLSEHLFLTLYLLSNYMFAASYNSLENFWEVRLQ